MRALILLLLFTLSSLASETSLNLQVKIMEKVLNEISINKERIIWSDNKTICKSFKKSNLIQTTPDCKQATIIILQDKNNLPKECAHCIVFVLDYELLSKVPKSFGAFFWKKGRPNIVILKSRLKGLSIQASSALEPYLEEKIW